MSVTRKPRPKSIIQDGKKLCLHCNTFKALAEFNDNKRSADGKQPYCRPCTSSRSREWRINNVAGVQKNNRAFRERSPEYGMAWQKENRELVRAYAKRWREDNPLLVRAGAVGTFGRRRAQDPRLVNTDADNVLVMELLSQEHCYYCTRYVLLRYRTIDHKTPLVRGGAHAAYNLCMACDVCNMDKGRMNEFEYRWYSGYDK